MKNNHKQLDSEAVVMCNESFDACIARWDVRDMY